MGKGGVIATGPLTAWGYLPQVAIYKSVRISKSLLASGPPVLCPT